MILKTPSVIYEDKALLVLAKPAGWITNRANTVTNQPVVEDWLNQSFVFSRHLPRHGIAHRLDKETSGLLLVAKTEAALANLQRQFKERKVRKTYVALVHGGVELPVGREGEINAPVGRLPWRRDRFGVLPGGRPAVTKYQVIRFPKIGTGKEKYTLLKLKPETGRTHQIRIHLKYLGHPVVGDEFYAGRKTARADRIWCPRLFLHAQAISFYHPETGRKVNFEGPLPRELKID